MGKNCQNEYKDRKSQQIQRKTKWEFQIYEERITKVKVSLDNLNSSMEMTDRGISELTDRPEEAMQ